MKPTKEEQKAINALNRLAKNWPKTMWLFSCSGSLIAMRCGEDGKHVIDEFGSMAQSHILEHINIGIDNDGGDF